MKVFQLLSRKLWWKSLWLLQMVGFKLLLIIWIVIDDTFFCKKNWEEIKVEHRRCILEKFIGLLHLIQSKWLIAVAFLGINIWRHDAEAVWALMGSVFNDNLSVTLKQILNQERPNSTLRSDPGMPSSHAQSIYFTTMFIILSIVEWYGINALTITLSGMLIILGSYFTWLRVSQNLHTVSQVVVGAIVGSSFSFLWFWSWKAYVLNLFVSVLWVRLLIIVAATGFVLNHLNHTYLSCKEE